MLVHKLLLGLGEGTELVAEAVVIGILAGRVVVSVLDIIDPIRLVLIMSARIALCRRNGTSHGRSLVLIRLYDQSQGGENLTQLEKAQYHWLRDSN